MTDEWLPYRNLLNTLYLLPKKSLGEAGELRIKIGRADFDLAGVRSGLAIQAVAGQFAGEDGGGVLRGVDEDDIGAEDALQYGFQERIMGAGENYGIDLRGFHRGQIFLEDELRGRV